MRIVDSCARCLLDKQKARVRNQPADKAAEYLARIGQLLENRGENDSSPYMVYRFNQIYAEYFGEGPGYARVKKEYNDLVLSMESEISERIEQNEDSLEASFLYARIGNYIDFGAMEQVDKAQFLGLFDEISMSDADRRVYRSFEQQCSEAERFLLVADNCGEIVLDKLFLRQLKKRYPNLEISVLVRGGEVLNDATREDALYAGMGEEAVIVSNGAAVAGTIYEMMPSEARKALDSADVILAKGQGNYESLSGRGRHVFYSFLCKCELFVNRFGVPALTGMFVEDNGNGTDGVIEDEKNLQEI